jgi:hypothetical protein
MRKRFIFRIQDSGTRSQEFRSSGVQEFRSSGAAEQDVLNPESWLLNPE